MNDFVTAIGFLRSITNAAKGLLNTREEVKVNQIAIELQGVALDLQSEMLVIQARYQESLSAREELEKKLIQYEDWNKERARYQLVGIGRIAFAYALKIGHTDGQPNHWICPTCYESRQKTILQRKDAGRIWCPRCKTEIETAKEP